MTWPTVRLADVAEVRLGRQRSPNNHIGPQMRPYMRAANVGWAGIKLDDVKSMNFTDSEMATYRLRSGDILLSEASGSAKEVGKPAMWAGEIADCGFQNTLLRVRSQGPDPQYLLHFFRWKAESGGFAALSRGVGIYHLGREALAALEVPLPHVTEQRRIAAILDKADVVRSTQRGALETFDVLTDSVFRQLFGDPLTNDRDWPDSLTLGEVADISSGVTKGRSLAGKASRSVPYLAVANVQNKSLDLRNVKMIEATEDEIRRYRVCEGDLMLTEGGDPDKLGRGCLWNDEIPECIHQNHIFRVRLTSSQFEPLFLNWLIGGVRGKRYFLKSAKQTTGIASINMTQLKAFPLLCPPIEIQREFGSSVTAIGQLRAHWVSAVERTDHLFESLQHRAFSGTL